VDLLPSDFLFCICFFSVAITTPSPINLGHWSQQGNRRSRIDIRMNSNLQANLEHCFNVKKGFHSSHGVFATLEGEFRMSPVRVWIY
jgi:hypothetical protein